MEVHVLYLAFVIQLCMFVKALASHSDMHVQQEYLFSMKLYDIINVFRSISVKYIVNGLMKFMYLLNLLFSGIGRENGYAVVEHYTQLKTIYVEMGKVDSPFVMEEQTQIVTDCRSRNSPNTQNHQLIATTNSLTKHGNRLKN